MQNYDLVILGGGTGGYVSAIRASQLGLRTAIIEKDKLGGTCLHRGCIPSKSLLQSADLYTKAKKLGDFGISVSDIDINFPKIQERKQKVVEQLYRGVQYLMNKGSIDVFEGTGEIVNPYVYSENLAELEVHNKSGEIESLLARNVIIATGSIPKDIPGLAIDGRNIINSDHALLLEELPLSIIIVGGGVIGIEWASMLADFGVQVSVVEAAEQVLPAEDNEISKEAQRLLQRKGIKFYTGAKLLVTDLRENEVLVSMEVKGKIKEIISEKLLVSVGRKANIDRIGLEKCGIETDNGVIQTNQYYQTSIPHIYAIGDVIGGLQLAHVASHEGIIAVEHLAKQNPKPMDYNTVPKCVYSHPQVASIGLTEQEAAKKEYSVKIGKFPFSAIGKALVQGEPEGFVKIIVDEPTKQLLGVHMVGPNVTELISEAGLAMAANISNIDFTDIIRPHPSLSEIFTEVGLQSDNIALHI